MREKFLDAVLGSKKCVCASSVVYITALTTCLRSRYTSWVFLVLEYTVISVVLGLADRCDMGVSSDSANSAHTSMALGS